MQKIGHGNLYYISFLFFNTTLYQIKEESGDPLNFNIFGSLRLGYTKKTQTV